MSKSPLLFFLHSYEIAYNFSVSPSAPWMTMTESFSYLTFSGTPDDNNQVDTYKITARRYNSSQHSQYKEKIIYLDVEANLPPVFKTLPDQEFEVPEIVDFTFPADSLIDPESLHMDISIKVNNADPPSWLIFDGPTLHFNVASITNANQGEYNITIYAKDEYNAK